VESRGRQIHRGLDAEIQRLPERPRCRRVKANTAALTCLSIWRQVAAVRRTALDSRGYPFGFLALRLKLGVSADDPAKLDRV
jgi:hypothetical protein